MDTRIHNSGRVLVRFDYSRPKVATMAIMAVVVAHLVTKVDFVIGMHYIQAKVVMAKGLVNTVALTMAALTIDYSDQTLVKTSEPMGLHIIIAMAIIP